MFDLLMVGAESWAATIGGYNRQVTNSALPEIPGAHVDLYVWNWRETALSLMAAHRPKQTRRQWRAGGGIDPLLTIRPRVSGWIAPLVDRRRAFGGRY